MRMMVSGIIYIYKCVNNGPFFYHLVVMDAKKTIQINPAFFSLSKKKTRKKDRKSTTQLRAATRPNDIKRKLIAKIKEHQQKKIDDGPLKQEEEDKFKDNFNTQLHYLEKVINNKQKQKRQRQTRQRQKRQRSLPHRHKEPPYGCLKNGKKPTFSQYNCTLKRRSLSIEQPAVAAIQKTPIIQARQEKLRELKEKIATPKPKILRHKKTIKIFRLGKNIKECKVGVLIKCSKTRKMVRNEQKVLRTKCLAEIKQYLRKHNLIKVGSNAPEDILRKIYEDSFLAGNIYNKNIANLLHNYISTDPAKSQPFIK